MSSSTSVVNSDINNTNTEWKVIFSVDAVDNIISEEEISMLDEEIQFEGHDFNSTLHLKWTQASELKSKARWPSLPGQKQGGLHYHTILMDTKDLM